MFSTLINRNIPVHEVVTQVVSIVDSVDITVLYIELLVVPEINTKLCIQFYILYNLVIID